MLRIMLQKLMHKKWMVISLLIGNILLVAIAVSHPMYKDASLRRMLGDEYENAFTDNNANPSLISFTGKLRKNTETTEYYKMKDMASNFCDILDVKQTMNIAHHRLQNNVIVSEWNRSDSKEKGVMLGSLSGISEYATALTGRFYSDEMDSDGYIEAVATMKGSVSMDLLLDEKLQFQFLKDKDGKPVKIKIVGIIGCAEGKEEYWLESPDSFEDEILISPVIYESLFLSEDKIYEQNSIWYVEYDYTNIDYTRVADIAKKTREIVSDVGYYSAVSEPAYLSILDNFTAKQKKVEVTLSILQVPVLVLLCAFLFMISRQMLEMEQSEISLLKSRGASKGQIFRLYLMQSFVLAMVGFAVGLPLGSLICRVLGASSAFLEFVQRRALNISYSSKVFMYAGAAVFVSVVMTVLPVLKQSGISIVKQKQKRARNNKPFWQKIYLDVIIFGLSIYAYYTFHSQMDNMELDVLAGKALNPLLFLSSSIFIMGASLLCLRIIPLFVRFIYFVGRKKWKPAGYAAFLEIIRTRNRKMFIMTFLMLTVALGIFNTTVARTIVSNAQNNKEYLMGTDVILREAWKSNIKSVWRDDVELVYTEPDFNRFSQIEDTKGVTKVYVNSQAELKKDSQADLLLYGIHTKTFGETIHFDNELLEKHINHYLNDLASNPEGILVSSNFRDILGYSVGDTVYFNEGTKTAYEYNKVTPDSAFGVIVGFVDYFPGYQNETKGLNPDNTAFANPKYLIVANLSMLQNEWGVDPYEVWISTDKPEKVYDYIRDNGISLNSYVDLEDEKAAIKRDTLFEGTNGILTMSFIVILILCGTGYLIYWILSIKSRELLFGVFRAMGMSKSEVMRMLILEQIFSSIVSLACGAGIGCASAILFVPMIQLAYSAAGQAIPLKLLMERGDMIKLFGVIAVTFIVCLVIIFRQVFKMKITQALKLGED